MSEPTPPRGGRMSRSFGGLPLWGWGVIVAAGLGAIVYFRLRRAGSAGGAAATTAPPADQQIGLTQYEQISSQLTGIEGTDQALLAAIKDMQGDKSREPDNDRSGDRDADTSRDRDEHRDRDEPQPRAGRGLPKNVQPINRQRRRAAA